MANTLQLARRSQAVSRRLALLSSAARDALLEKIAQRLEERAEEILKANARDIRVAKKNSLGDGLIDRLLLTPQRLKNIVGSVRTIATLHDYVGETIESRQLRNGLFLKRVRVPLGVVLMVYEARPNVTIDAASLAIKSGNAVILKGGSDALQSNIMIVQIIREVLEQARLEDAVQLVDSTDHAVVKELLKLRAYIDVVIPRGSARLIEFVRKNTRIPMIETGASVVHTYVHKDADIEKAVAIVMNSKLRRVSICNALDSLVLHEKCAEKFLQAFVAGLRANTYGASHLELRASPESYRILKKLPAPKNFRLHIAKATARDYDTEFLDYVLAIKTVGSLEEALAHISAHSLKHSEAIVTESQSVAQRFLSEVDAACVYWNASTQFSDGQEFGLGAEMGISTQKLHTRGPFALEGLSSYKWIVEGSGQTR